MIPEISLRDISGITTKASCEVALMGERHVRIEISDFVMRTFVLSQAAFAKGLEIRCSVCVCAIRLQVRSYTGALFEK